MQATRRSSGLHEWQKVIPSFLSYFKTLGISPAPRIEPTTSRSGVTRFTDWANPALVKR